MEFLLNNPVILFVVITGIGFIGLMVKKLIDEFQLNQALQLKQRSLRIVKSTTKPFTRRVLSLATATVAPVVLVFVMVMFGTVNDPNVIQNDYQISRISSSEDIIALHNQFKNINQSFYRNFDFEFGVTDDLATPEASKDEGTAGDDKSDTNNQVQGVDEMDNVLNDGKYIYLMTYENGYENGNYYHKGKVQIIHAYTKEYKLDGLGIVKELYFSDFIGEESTFNPTGLYEDDQRLLVIGTTNDWTCVDYMYYEEDKVEDDYVPECYNNYSNPRTQVFVFEKETLFDDDLTNDTPDSFEFSGYMIGTRKINDALYIVTNNYIPFHMFQNQIENMNMDDFLPTYRIGDQEMTVDYSDILYEEGVNPENFTSFYGINLSTNEVSKEVVLGESGYTLYVSLDNMYLAGTKYTWSTARFEEDGEVTEYENVEPQTNVIRMAINGGIVSFNGGLNVDGIGLDQFAMDEHEGYFRIVTSSNSNWFWWGWTDPQINNRLVIFDEDLNEVSRIENIGKPGESVQSTRFVGDYFYIVTFLRTDPFYIFDLSDPENPFMTAELEVPGFSDYLQPINENYMLGIGYGDSEGGTAGLKFSLYDVTNKYQTPTTTDIIFDYDVEGYMWTPTTYNHKDLLMAVHRGFIALPYTRNYEDSNGNWRYETGIQILLIDLDSETEKLTAGTRIVHSDGTDYNTYVFKSIYIEEYFYTISNKFIKANTIDDMIAIRNTSDSVNILESIIIGQGYDDLEDQFRASFVD